MSRWQWGGGGRRGTRENKKGCDGRGNACARERTRRERERERDIDYNERAQEKIERRAGRERCAAMVGRLQEDGAVAATHPYYARYAII